ncbi:MAG: protein translocase subunit SecF [Kiritimatiellae bacterium]|nr:protein translocase subunit SecF [Kiritimatiellia bacterium]
MDTRRLVVCLITFCAVVASVFLVVPVDQKVRLGLDLRGGASFVLEVDTSGMGKEEAADAQERAVTVIRNRIDQTGVREPIVYAEAQSRIVVQLPGLPDEQRKIVEQNLNQVGVLQFRMVHEDQDKMAERLWAAEIAPKGYTIETDPLSQGTRHYYERKPDAPAQFRMDPELAKALKQNDLAPPLYEFMLMPERGTGKERYRPYWVKKTVELSGENLKTAGLSFGGLVQDPVVTLEFDAKGAKRFGAITSAHAPGGHKNEERLPDGVNYPHHYLAIVLDGTLASAPWIKTAIHDGKAIIEGNFSLEEAEALRIVLRAGALPAPVRLLEKHEVSASLGPALIRSALRSFVVAGAIVFVFMAIWYRLSGLIAIVALVLLILTFPFGMVLVSNVLAIPFGGTGTGAVVRGGWAMLPVLTLPSIAGIVLTLGMAVDGNVLIFERLREDYEESKGTSFRSFGTSVAEAYKGAFLTIVDANLTTLIAAVILYWQGSGPLRGFAIALGAGIVVSMFTILWVTRVLYDFLAESPLFRRQREAGQMQMMGRGWQVTNWDFLGKRRLMGVVSVLVIVVSLALVVVKGKKNLASVLGVDFLGGSAVTFSASDGPGVGEITAALEAAGLQQPLVQYQTDLDTGKRFLEVRTEFDKQDIAVKELQAKFPNAGFTVVREDRVGSQIGVELRRKGIKAIVMALIGLGIYIAIRFKNVFRAALARARGWEPAIGAGVALLHDVFVTAGVFCVFRPMSLTVVAALLTIVGYSINDTIVIFARIRDEWRKASGHASFYDTCNLAINKTLRRTLLTSLTTLFPVLVLLVFGGGGIRDFAATLCIGVIVGTYSSVFIATPIVLFLRGAEMPKKARK